MNKSIINYEGNGKLLNIIETSGLTNTEIFMNSFLCWLLKQNCHEDAELW